MFCFGKVEIFQQRILQSDEYEEDKLLKSCLLELVLKGTDIGLLCAGYWWSRWPYEQFGKLWLECLESTGYNVSRPSYFSSTVLVWPPLWLTLLLLILSMVSQACCLICRSCTLSPGFTIRHDRIRSWILKLYLLQLYPQSPRTWQSVEMFSILLRRALHMALSFSKGISPQTRS